MLAAIITRVTEITLIKRQQIKQKDHPFQKVQPQRHQPINQKEHRHQQNHPQHLQPLSKKGLHPQQNQLHPKQSQRVHPAPVVGDGEDKTVFSGAGKS